MKTHTIKTPTAELLIVELPRKADVEIFPNSIEIYNQFTGQEESIKGSYTLLGKPVEIREEDARELVEERTDMEGNCYYEDHGIINGTTPSSKDSLLSLLESEIYWLNPTELEKWENYFGISGNIVTDEWHGAEKKTFDRNRTLIFVKN